MGNYMGGPGGGFDPSAMPQVPRQFQTGFGSAGMQPQGVGTYNADQATAMDRERRINAAYRQGYGMGGAPAQSQYGGGGGDYGEAPQSELMKALQSMGGYQR